MNHLAFDLIRFPDTQKALDLIQGNGQNGLLAVIDSPANGLATDLAYLEKIMEAVGLSPLAEKIYWIGLEEATLLPISGLCEEKAIDRVVFFGYPPAKGGIQAELAAYQWQKIAAVQYLLVDWLDTIRQEREAGKSEKAKALWAALKLIKE